MDGLCRGENMKNRIWSWTCFALASCCLVACGDGDSGSELSPDGMVCNSSSECLSKYCNDAHYCAPNPANLLNVGEKCTKSSECKSDYCDNNGECANKPGELLELGAPCSKSSECKSEYCNENSVCAENPNDHGNHDEDKLGKQCNEHADCGEYFCVSNTCVTIEQVNRSECNSSDSPYCLGDYLVKCRVYAGMSYVNDVTDCASKDKKCMINNQVAICAEPCTANEVGNEKTVCDEDNLNWEGYSVGVEVYKCLQIQNDYYYVFDRYENCALNDICLVDEDGCI